MTIATPAGGLRAGSVPGALRSRVLGLAEALPGPAWLAVQVETGVLRLPSEDAEVRGPALVWRPWPAGARAVFEPGAVGAYILIGPTAFAESAGGIPETREIREALSEPVTVAPAPAMAPTRTAFSCVCDELGSGRAAAPAVVAAYLRVILVELFRHAGMATAEPGAGPPAHRGFARFAALVESRFRDRWTVNDYARGLGMSRDRLGDICRRARGLGPKEVIDRRLVAEAKLQLRTSSASVQEIAAMLGFASAPQFAHFFKRRVGLPPGAFRTAQSDPGGDAPGPARPYDWP